MKKSFFETKPEIRNSQSESIIRYNRVWKNEFSKNGLIWAELRIKRCLQKEDLRYHQGYKNLIRDHKKTFESGDPCGRRPRLAHLPVALRLGRYYPDSRLYSTVTFLLCFLLFPCFFAVLHKSVSKVSTFLQTCFDALISQSPELGNARIDKHVVPQLPQGSGSMF